MSLQANQGEMGVVLDGKYHGITEYVEASPVLSKE
jgi:hypothetical protein